VSSTDVLVVIVNYRSGASDRRQSTVRSAER
jgi:hypothetical protein